MRLAIANVQHVQADSQARGNCGIGIAANLQQDCSQSQFAGNKMLEVIASMMKKGRP